MAASWGGYWQWEQAPPKHNHARRMLYTGHTGNHVHANETGITVTAEHTWTWWCVDKLHSGFGPRAELAGATPEYFTHKNGPPDIIPNTVGDVHSDHVRALGFETEDPSHAYHERGPRYCAQSATERQQLEQPDHVAHTQVALVHGVQSYAFAVRSAPVESAHRERRIQDQWRHPASSSDTQEQPS
jgi:hypothetical protein